MKTCECEHISHASHVGDRTPYCMGERINAIRTPYGVFILCDDCYKADHMPGHAVGTVAITVRPLARKTKGG